MPGVVEAEDDGARALTRQVADLGIVAVHHENRGARQLAHR